VSVGTKGGCDVGVCVGVDVVVVSSVATAGGPCVGCDVGSPPVVDPGDHAPVATRTITMPAPTRMGSAMSARTRPVPPPPPRERRST
jgi:hypothetical protein